MLFGLDDHLERRGIDPYRFGSACGIRDDIWDDADGQVPLNQFVGLLEQASSETAEPGIGWSFGGAFDMMSLGELGKTIMHAPNLGAALKNFANYLLLIQSATELRLEIGQTSAQLIYRILDPDIWPRQQDAEFSLAIFMGIFRRFLGPDWCPIKLSFEHGPNQAIQGWNERLGTECYFDCGTNIITFPVDVLAHRAPDYDRDFWTRQTAALDRMLVRRNRRRAVTSRVKSAVFANLGRVPVDQNTIARQLGLSRRSMHRRLEMEGTRFSALLAGCRMKLARQRLEHGNQPLSRIAIDLNYSDQSAFTRAFKRDCGIAPHRYRRDRRADNQARS